MALRAGDWVEVRTRQEILQTLDRNGRLDGMPLMPQMLSYCGQILRVLRSAHKTCDPVYTSTSRRLPNAVHLDLRCDGKAYGGCQAGCLLFWKDAWLKPVSDGSFERPSMNRGLYFDVEEVPFCGSVYRVRSRVERFIDERTGRIKSLKTPAVILEGVWCCSRFSTCRMFCPRALYSWWREIWLERVYVSESGEASPTGRCESSPKGSGPELGALGSSH